MPILVIPPTPMIEIKIELPDFEMHKWADKIIFAKKVMDGPVR